MKLSLSTMKLRRFFMQVVSVLISYPSFLINFCRWSQEFPSGESPSFASDSENPNQTLAAEKVTLSNTVRSSPRVTGNHALSSENRSSLSQFLAFVCTYYSFGRLLVLLLLRMKQVCAQFIDIVDVCLCSPTVHVEAPSHRQSPSTSSSSRVSSFSAST